MVMNDIRPIEAAQPQTARESRSDEMYCPSCGSIIKREAAICVSCGVATRRSTTYHGSSAGTGQGKSKPAAILFAIFFGFFTWLYTYREDSGKFWTCAIVTVASIVLSVLTLGLWLFLWIPASFGIWIWTIVDAATKNEEWYENY